MSATSSGLAASSIGGAMNPTTGHDVETGARPVRSRETSEPDPVGIKADLLAGFAQRRDPRGLAIIAAARRESRSAPVWRRKVSARRVRITDRPSSRSTKPTSTAAGREFDRMARRWAGLRSKSERTMPGAPRIDLQRIRDGWRSSRRKILVCRGQHQPGRPSMAQEKTTRRARKRKGRGPLRSAARRPMFHQLVENTAGR